MLLPIKEGIADILLKVVQLNVDTEFTEGWAGSFEYQLGKAVGRKVKLDRARSVKSIRDEGS